MSDIDIDLSKDEKFELYHRISENEQELDSILTVKDEYGVLKPWNELDLQIVEKIEWNPTEIGNYTFDINGSKNIVDVLRSNIIIENFADEDFNNYKGDIGDFSIEDNATNAYSGNYYLQGISTGGAASHIHSTSGLVQYPKINDTYIVRIWWNPDSGARDCAISWFTGNEDDSPDCHQLKFSWDDNRIELKEIGGDGIVDTTDVNPNNYNSEWHTIYIDINDESEQTTVSIENSSGEEWAGLSAIMNYRSDGGIGFQVNGDASRSGGLTGRFDYIELR